MDEECIHGLQTALCGVCSPRTPPAAAPGSATSRGTKTQHRAAQTRTAARGTGVATPTSSRRLSALRVHHLTPIANFAAILADGALRPNAAPNTELSSELTQQLRAAAELPGGASVADAVPFYLDVGARRWVELLEGASGPSWSDAARRVHPGDLAVLSWPVAALADRAVLADADAAAVVARFVALADEAAAQAAFARLEREARLGEAELLVPGPVALDGLALVCVANEPARAEVAGLLKDSGYVVRTAVHPPWFMPPERSH